MAGSTESRTGRYLYAVVGNGTVVGDLTGIDGHQVYSIASGQLVAVVSDVPNQKLRPERRHLAAHQGVLNRLVEAGGVLPMVFGIIADSAEAIEAILTKNRDTLNAQLERVAGKVEMGLRVRWDVPNIFAYFVDAHPELKTVRNRLFSSNRELTRDEKIELGQLFERLLNADRQAHAQKVEEILAPRCFELRLNPPRDEREVINLACLIGSGARAVFEEGVFAAAALFDDRFAFDYNGPWAPHNFVDLNLEI